mmetsp:Transcript_19891/g.56878  ORF Transcript_19891/g.56878 Transcript_19891/m.56878 type:complete len:239 (+) Transcript_19891:602-1318(+)
MERLRQGSRDWQSRGGLQGSIVARRESGGKRCVGWNSVRRCAGVWAGKGWHQARASEEDLPRGSCTLDRGPVFGARKRDNSCGRPSRDGVALCKGALGCGFDGQQLVLLLWRRWHRPYLGRCKPTAGAMCFARQWAASPGCRGVQRSNAHRSRTEWKRSRNLRRNRLVASDQQDPLPTRQSQSQAARCQECQGDLRGVLAKWQSGGGWLERYHSLHLRDALAQAQGALQQELGVHHPP